VCVVGGGRGVVGVVVVNRCLEVGKKRKRREEKREREREESVC